MDMCISSACGSHKQLLLCSASGSNLLIRGTIWRDGFARHKGSDVVLGLAKEEPRNNVCLDGRREAGYINLGSEIRVRVRVRASATKNSGEAGWRGVYGSGTRGWGIEIVKAARRDDMGGWEESGAQRDFWDVGREERGSREGEGEGEGRNGSADDGRVGRPGVRIGVSEARDDSLLGKYNGRREQQIGDVGELRRRDERLSSQGRGDSWTYDAENGSVELEGLRELPEAGRERLLTGRNGARRSDERERRTEMEERRGRRGEVWEVDEQAAEPSDIPEVFFEGRTPYEGVPMQGREPVYSGGSMRGREEKSEGSTRDLPVLSPSLATDRPPDKQFFVDEEYDRLLVEADALYKEGREGLDGKVEVAVAEQMLYEAVRLLDSAAQLKPSELAPLGQCGNALLAHGELKLKLVRQFREAMGPFNQPMRGERGSRLGGLGRGGPSQAEVLRYEEMEQQRREAEELMYEVADECDRLLIEAGRRYRAALTLNNRDVRALYNWGLALCYRGQLIADEAEEGYVEAADKMFLAAIDKFEAMLAVSDKWRAGALLNWGTALRDRSRLRPMGSGERIRLLEQCKELLEEASQQEPKNRQVRGALAACNIELRSVVRYAKERVEEERRPLPPPSQLKGWW